MSSPNATNMLYELRKLLPKLESIGTTEDSIILLEFLRKFEEFDTHLSGNGQFPVQWITKAGQYQLKPHELNVSHDYTDPDYRKLGIASCGHREYSRDYCAEILCSNYVQKHLGDDKTN